MSYLHCMKKHFGISYSYKNSFYKCNQVTTCSIVITSQNYMTTNASNGPLSGIRILDLSRILAGPFATMILGDLGAEIIKIEKPGIGDDTRSFGPPYKGTESCYFLSINRNKKSVAVDFKHPKGLEIVKNISKKCDILVENYMPGTLKKVGLCYDSLHKIAPQLIYCSVTGYGTSGPYSKRAGYDVMAAAMGGLIGVTGPKGGEPCKVGVAMTDLCTGLYLQGAVMAALLHRFKTKEGQKIECDLLSTQISCMVNVASNYLNAGIDGSRLGTEHESIVPYQAFPTVDGYIAVGALNDRQFIILCKRLGTEGLSQNGLYRTNDLRVKNRATLIKKLECIFLKKTTKQWLEILEGSSLPYSPINNMENVFSDPHVQHNRMVSEFMHPTAGTIKLVNPAVKFSSFSNEIQSLPPTLGQHTKEVLSDLLNYSPSLIDELEMQEVIQCL